MSNWSSYKIQKLLPPLMRTIYSLTSVLGLCTFAGTFYAASRHLRTASYIQPGLWGHFQIHGVGGTAGNIPRVIQTRKHVILETQYNVALVAALEPT